MTTNDSTTDFWELVERMRQAQKECFCAKAASLAGVLELEVDQALKDRQQQLASDSRVEPGPLNEHLWNAQHLNHRVAVTQIADAEIEPAATLAKALLKLWEDTDAALSDLSQDKARQHGFSGIPF